MNRLPNLLIIGVFKAGTTSLFHYLNQHPQVCGPTKKETHFFSPIVFKNEALGNLDDYKKFFSNCQNEKYILEASPSYFYGGDQLISIFKNTLPPKHKVILVIRDPIDKFISNYNFIKSRAVIPQEETIETFLDKCIEEDKKYDDIRIDTYSNTLKECRYAQYLKKWLNEYSKEDMYICFFDDFKNSKELMINISKWLNIDEEFYEDFSFTIENKTVHPKFPGLHKHFVSINKRYENFFRKNHNLKKRLRSIYFLFNKRKSENSIPQTVEEKLTQIYKQPNKELRDILIANGFNNIPDWCK